MVDCSSFCRPHISIHALRGEGDKYSIVGYLPELDFNPRPPWGGRRVQSVRRLVKIKISIHALRGEGDPDSCYQATVIQISIHALRGEGDDVAH